MSGVQASSPAAAATAATAATARQGRSAGHFVRRIFELFWLLLATLAALFFFKTAQETSEENSKLRDELRRSAAKKESTNRCSVCLSNPCEVVLQPCGHVCLCRDCVTQISSTNTLARTQSSGKCPVCRSSIESHHNIYLSQMNCPEQR